MVRCSQPFQLIFYNQLSKQGSLVKHISCSYAQAQAIDIGPIHILSKGILTSLPYSTFLPPFLASIPPQIDHLPPIIYELPAHIEDFLKHPLPSTHLGFSNKDGYVPREPQRHHQPHTDQSILILSPNCPLPKWALTLGTLWSSKSPSHSFLAKLCFQILLVKRPKLQLN